MKMRAFLLKWLVEKEVQNSFKIAANKSLRKLEKVHKSGESGGITEKAV